MTCPDPANNRECLHLHNGKCLASRMDDKPIATFYAYDYDEARNYANMYKYIGALRSIRERVKAWRKHGHDFKSADVALDEVYALIIDEMQGLED